MKHGGGLMVCCLIKYNGLLLCCLGSRLASHYWWTRWQKKPDGCIFLNCYTCNVKRTTHWKVCAIQPLLYAWAHRRPWLASIAVIYRVKRVYHPSLPLPGQVCSFELPALDPYAIAGIWMSDPIMIGQTLFCYATQVEAQVKLNHKCVMHQDNNHKYTKKSTN